MGFATTATNKSGGDYEIAPAGPTPAVLVAVIDLGTHEEEYQGVKRSNRQAFLVWELSDEKKKSGDSFLIGQSYNLFGSTRSKLRILLAQWRGNEFAEGEVIDPRSFLGQTGMLNVAHKTNAKGNTFAFVNGITKLHKSVPTPKATYPLTQWTLDDGQEFPADKTEWLPYCMGKKVADLIANCLEKGGSGSTIGNEAIPF